jgi:PGF-pre-PGF domain-containing protein
MHLQIKLNKLIYFGVGLTYVGIVLFLVSMTAGAALVDNATIELISAIEDANGKVESATAGIEPGQYPQSAINAFNKAISKAQSVANDDGATQSEVNQAVSDLKAAEAVFDAAKIVSVNKTALTSAISAASLKVNSAVAGVVIGQYPQSAITSFKETIGQAQVVADKAGATQAEVNRAVRDLKAAETIFDAAKITTGDSTPPASVTNLQNSAVGPTWIRWTWTNPTDSDFSHVTVYIDNSFVTTTSNAYYELSRLAEGTIHTIGLQTVDTTGNINTERVNDAATTAATLPKITSVSGKDITTNSITLLWESSTDTASVKITRDDVLLSTVNGQLSYVDSGLESGTTYDYTLIPYTDDGLEGEAVSVNLKTKSSGKSGGGSSGSSSKKSSSSGGGGAGSAEDFTNVVMKDVANVYLMMGSNAVYEFSREGNAIQSISLYSLKNSGEITSTIEVLNEKSKLVHSDPDGRVYRYLNIWVGKAGFATSDSIRDARIRFKVNNSWIEEMGVSPEEVSLQRYNGSSWEVLPTTFEGNIGSYTIFEASTPGFSPFAITAEKAFASSANGTATVGLAHVEDIALEGTQPEKSKIWTYIMTIILIGLFAVGYEYLKKDQQK